MPQPVLEYLKEKDFRAADRIKRQVPRLYPDDVTNLDGICSQQSRSTLSSTRSAACLAPSRTQGCMPGFSFHAFSSSRALLYMATRENAASAGFQQVGQCDGPEEIPAVLVVGQSEGRNEYAVDD